jgi:hypothetical protein
VEGKSAICASADVALKAPAIDTHAVTNVLKKKEWFMAKSPAGALI